MDNNKIYYSNSNLYKAMNEHIRQKKRKVFWSDFFSFIGLAIFMYLLIQIIILLQPYFIK